MKGRIKDYKCGDMQTKFKGFICGYFKTEEYRPVKIGKILPYLGEVREERYLVQLNDLRYKKEEWMRFLQENELV